MQTRNFLKIGTAAVFSLFLAACNTTGNDMEDANATDDSMNTEAVTRPVTTNTGPTAEELARQREMEEIERMLAIKIFYFDFDQSELKPEAREALVYHANYLKANPTASIRLEGHADERGTREYNLALGERRAQAVERYLIVQGVSSNQIETISYGEEMPAATGSTEASYARNRRVEMK